LNAPERHRLILRAELTIRGETIVTRTRELSADEIVLPTSSIPPLGTPVTLRLSFPGLVEAFELSGEVTAHHASDGPGEAPALTIGIRDCAELSRERFARLLAPQDASVPSTSGFHILIVEDNGMIRDMFAYGVHKYFKTHGSVKVDVAPDGAAAWELLAGARYDLAIVDYYLPIVNGAQLIERIRGDERFVRLPVVAISIGGEDARSASIQAGADLFLDKPVVLRDLFATLDRLALQKEHSAS
jgi:CheY-like chemotaxis protein